MFVYVIVNSETLKIYIGQHKGANLQKYLRQKQAHARYGASEYSHLYSAMRKHDWGVWSIHPLISDLKTSEECDYWEKVLIKCLKSQHPDVGYNICDGGQGNRGFSWSPAQHEKAKMLPQYATGRTLSAEHRQRIQESLRGRIFTKEWREKISKAKMGNNGARIRWGNAKENRIYCSKGHALTEANCVPWKWRKGTKVCVMCDREWRRDRYIKKKGRKS